MIVFNDNRYAQEIIQAAHVTDFVPDRDVSITRVGKDGLLGGVIFQEYTGPGGSVNIHVAGLVDKWMNRELMWHTFNLAFVTLKVKKLIGKVHSGNLKALKFDLKLGFTAEAVIKDVFPDGDLIVLSMNRDQCRWLGLPRPVKSVINGQEST